MGLLLKSHHHTTLIQLATGFGKSLMLALLAKYINKTTGKKVIILVPSDFLHAYQQSFYCPSASNIPDDITDPACK
jgi:ERCC4-related helicase